MTVGRLHRRLTPVLSARMERAEGGVEDQTVIRESEGEVVDRLRFYSSEVRRLLQCLDDIHRRLTLPDDLSEDDFDGPPRNRSDEYVAGPAETFR